MDFPGRLIAGFLVLIILFIFPLQYIAGSANERIDVLVDNKTRQLSDSVREKGYLDKQMYEEYTGFLDTTGEIYDIEVQDIRPVKGEDFKLGFNSMADYEYTNNRYTQPAELVGNAKTSVLKTSTTNVTTDSERKLAYITVWPDCQTIQRYSLPVFTVTVNYDDGSCRLLDSSEYKVSGLNTANISLQCPLITYTEGEISTSATVNVNVTTLLRKCPNCKQLYELCPDDTDSGCPHCREHIIGIEVNPAYVELTQGDTLPVTVNAIYNDGSKAELTEWISNYNSEKPGIQIVSIKYEGYEADITVWVNERLIACPTCTTLYPEGEEGCPVCAEKIVRISASPKNITVMQYEPISLDVTVYYADGSSKATDEWTIDRTSVTPGVFEATVSFKGVSDTISLNVLTINSIQCPICSTIYDLSENSKGCPICSNEITGIEAYLTNGTNRIQLGSAPALAVILIFRDEHREFTLEDYELDDYNPYEPGEQTVRVLYKGFVTTIIVEIVNMLDGITCPNGHIYYRNSDGTDPGCSFCHDVSESSSISYFDITYTTEILHAVYSYGIYHFQYGNYISVRVTKKDKSLLHHLQRTFFGTSLLGRKKSFIYGGEVCSS